MRRQPRLAALSPAQLPADPDAGIRVKTRSGTLRVFLPANAASGHARDTPQGHAVYDGADADTAVIADLNGGVAIATIAPAAGRAQQRFRYRLDLPEGQRLVPQGDGSIEIRGGDGANVATIEAPWAVDSTGRSLPTSYSVDRTWLTQTVKTVGAIGDVTADPHLVLHGPKITLFPPSISPPYLTLWFTRHETEEIYRRYKSTIDSGATAASALCAVTGVLANLAPPVKAIITVMCAAATVYVQDLRVNLEQAHSNNNCLNVDIKPQGDQYKSTRPAVVGLEDRNG
jgi:hypothetical protein